ncbi:MAG TPA: hypothetical protein VFN49_09915 [Candidatus Aquilonibacter sp.]|nr:hypothetical protein [Candidatus Aquilonibacter sp.]
MEVQPAPTATTPAETAVGQSSQVAAASNPQSVQGVVPASSQSNPGIAPAIAKLFGSGSPQPIQLNVSYRVEGSDVVTVFTDPKTGKEVAQFPPELLLGLAKFFDQQSGVTFDKNA